MAYELPQLPYAYDALEPHIDQQTMHLHHEKHHNTYVTNLNNAIEKHPEADPGDLEQLLASIDSVPEDIRTAVRNNGGGHSNHSMFWQIMGGSGGEPQGDLRSAIERDLGGMQRFQDEFSAAGGSVFGSGWVFVTVDRTGKLAIATKPN